MALSQHPNVVGLRGSYLHAGHVFVVMEAMGGGRPPPSPLPSRTEWTRLVPPPVPSGYVFVAMEAMGGGRARAPVGGPASCCRRRRLAAGSRPLALTVK
jgi:hypothetical protein